MYKAATIKHTASSTQGYSTALNFYRVPPVDDISVDELENLAIERRKLLKEIENIYRRTQDKNEIQQETEAACRKYMKLTSIKNDASAQNERRRDHISHFILRLAYSRTKSKQEWFTLQEKRLFMHRLTKATEAERKAFIDELNLNYKEMDKEEQKSLYNELKRTFNTKIDVKTGKFYKVNFEDALELVQQRRVYLRGGTAYVPHEELISLVIEEFQRHLTDSFEIYAARLAQLEKDTEEGDERLRNLLQNIDLHASAREQHTAAVAGNIRARDVASLSRYFPLCMKYLHDRLQIEGHMRHGGRMQFGLFLKGIGLPVEESLIYWQESFKKISEDVFNKQYAYNIRHNYGLEGKRADYQPYNCMRIITTNRPGPGEHHGCPFRHFSEGNLRQELLRFGVPEDDIPQIIQLAAGNHCQAACSKVFKSKELEPRQLQGQDIGDIEELIETPNQYFNQAYRLAHGNTITNTEDTPGGSAYVGPTQSRKRSRPTAYP